MGLVKKPTGFMTSSKCIAKELDKKCDGGHSHVPLMAGRAAAAQVSRHFLRGNMSRSCEPDEVREVQHRDHRQAVLHGAQEIREAHLRLAGVQRQRDRAGTINQFE